MSPIVLFRKSLADKGEIDVCRKYFTTIEYRSELAKYIAENELYQTVLVIPRYSALPYYQELETDVNNLGGTLINSYKQHKWIANFEWYEPLKEYTPQSWTDDNFFSAPIDKEYVVKGRTNSKKHQWNKLMHAENKRRALEISGELIQDGLLGEQGIIYREYVPLKTYEIGINGLPFTDEWRFFFYKDILLSVNYYWCISDYIPKSVPKDIINFAQDLSVIVKEYVNFFVLDCAITKDNKPILIEINDASQSGLSEYKADELYGNLKNILGDCGV